jgi:hypothetical protein
MSKIYEADTLSVLARAAVRNAVRWLWHSVERALG